MELKFGFSSVGRYSTKAATGLPVVRFVTFPCTGIPRTSLKSSLVGPTPGALGSSWNMGRYGIRSPSFVPNSTGWPTGRPPRR